MPRPVASLSPTVLAWAIRESGLTAADLADHLDVPPATLDAWTRGTSSPSLTQARKLAARLRRPLAVFFLPAPPEPARAAAKFRHPPDSDRDALNPKETAYMREAIRLQRLLGWLLEELDEPEVRLPGIAKLSPEEVGNRLRAFIGAPADPTNYTPSQYVAAWRAALEHRGISVFFLPLGADGCRGFSLAHPRAPLIVVNTAFSAPARLFSMLHELGHLVRGTDSVCSTDAVIGAAADPEERWCEATAASTLIPWPECTAFMTAKLGWQGAKVTELAQAKRIATHFRVSLRAAVLRLIEHGAASWPLFRAIPPAADSKSGGGGGEGRTRLQARRDELGERTLDLVARGLRRDLLGRGDVVAYLRVPPLALEQEAAGAS